MVNFFQLIWMTAQMCLMIKGEIFKQEMIILNLLSHKYLIKLMYYLLTHFMKPAMLKSYFLNTILY